MTSDEDAFASRAAELRDVLVSSGVEPVALAKSPDWVFAAGVTLAAVAARFSLPSDDTRRFPIHRGLSVVFDRTSASASTIDDGMNTRVIVPCDAFDVIWEIAMIEPPNVEMWEAISGEFVAGFDRGDGA